jgi:hypothetical protein
MKSREEGKRLKERKASDQNRILEIQESEPTAVVMASFRSLESPKSAIFAFKSLFNWGRVRTRWKYKE